ncbi:MAG: prepilin-type N-terminal cleavage/methylation domain-containing protein [Burkholderiales bacterium]
MRPGIAHRLLARGFTLIELLVVMTMVSLIALAMAGSLRTMAQTEARVDERLLRADDFRVASHFIRTTLGRVSMRRIEPPPPLGSNLFVFAAESSALSWVGVMPARPGAGGRSAFRLALEGDPGAQDLVIRFAPLDDAYVFPDWSTAQARVLASQVTEFSVAYQDARQLPAQWLPQWTAPDRLPSHVKLTVQTQQGGWPDLVVALRTLPATTRAAGPTFGGSTGDEL